MDKNNATMSLRLPDRTKSLLACMAKVEGVELSDFVRQTLEAKVKPLKRKNAKLGQ